MSLLLCIALLAMVSLCLLALVCAEVAHSCLQQHRQDQARRSQPPSATTLQVHARQHPPVTATKSA